MKFMILISITTLILFLSGYFEVYKKVLPNIEALKIPHYNFAAVGDMSCKNNAYNVINSISKTSPEVILGLGDYSYQKNADCWLEMIENISLEDTLFGISIGNHEDVPSLGLNQYLDYFGIKSNFYSFDYKNTHFLSIDTNVNMKLDSEQFNFIKEDLQNAASDPTIDWIVVFGHKPAYNSPCDSVCTGKQEFRNIYHPIFDQYGVDLILLAHVHSYMRYYPISYNNDQSSNPIITNFNEFYYKDPKNPITVIVGTGGESLMTLTGTKDYIAFQEDSFYGHLNIDIINNGKVMVGTFISKDGYIIDEFSISKSSEYHSESSPYYQVQQQQSPSPIQKQTNEKDIQTNSILSLPEVIEFSTSE